MNGSSCGPSPPAGPRAQPGADPLANLTAMAAEVLDRYSWGSGASVSLLNLSENATFLVSTPAKTSVLRIHRPGYHAIGDIASELAWLAALRRDGVAEVVEPLADRQGNLIQTLPSRCGGPQRHAVMFAFMAGREPLPGDDLAPWFQRLGELTAKLHSHAKGWKPPADFTRQVWDTEAMHGARPLWGRWQNAVGLDREGQKLLGQTVQRIKVQLAAYGQGPERFGLVHADLRLANLLIDSDRLKLLDFDDCGFSWFMYDFAAAVSFHEHLPTVAALRDAWLRGYQTIAPLGAEDRAILPALVMARRILLLAWIASHGEVPLAQDLGAGYTNQSLGLAESYLEGKFLAS